MKASELRKIAKAYDGLFPADWKLVNHDWMRRNGSWMQIVSFNDSRHAPQYEPRSSLEFLKFPGPIHGGFLFCGLREKRHNVQRWVTLKQHESGVAPIFQDMTEQFCPSIIPPLQIEEVKILLQGRLHYWPHVYALCVMAAEKGNEPEARHHFDLFCQMMADKPFDWVGERRSELDRVMELLNTPAALKVHLDEIERMKLATAKLNLPP